MDLTFPAGGFRPDPLAARPSREQLGQPLPFGPAERLVVVAVVPLVGGYIEGGLCQGEAAAALHERTKAHRAKIGIPTRSTHAVDF